MDSAIFESLTLLGYFKAKQKNRPVNANNHNISGFTFPKGVLSSGINGALAGKRMQKPYIKK